MKKLFPVIIFLLYFFGVSVEAAVSSVQYNTANGTVTQPVPGGTGTNFATGELKVNGVAVSGGGGSGGTAPFNISNVTLNSIFVGNNTGVGRLLGPVNGSLVGWNGTGAATNITLGSNLTLTGNVLNASGGGASTIPAANVTAGTLAANVTGVNGTISGNATAQLATFKSVSDYTAPITNDGSGHYVFGAGSPLAFLDGNLATLSVNSTTGGLIVSANSNSPSNNVFLFQNSNTTTLFDIGTFQNKSPFGTSGIDFADNNGNLTGAIGYVNASNGSAYAGRSYLSFSPRNGFQPPSFTQASSGVGNFWIAQEGVFSAGYRFRPAFEIQEDWSEDIADMKSNKIFTFMPASDRASGTLTFLASQIADATVWPTAVGTQIVAQDSDSNVTILGQWSGNQSFHGYLPHSSTLATYTGNMETMVAGAGGIWHLYTGGDNVSNEIMTARAANVTIGTQGVANLTVNGSAFSTNGTILGNDTNRLVTSHDVLNYTVPITLNSGVYIVNGTTPASFYDGTNATLTVNGSFGAKLDAGLRQASVFQFIDSNTTNGGDVGFIQNLSNGGDSAIDYDDLNGNILGAMGYGNPGGSAPSANHMYLSTNPPIVPPFTVLPGSGIGLFELQQEGYATGLTGYKYTKAIATEANFELSRWNPDQDKVWYITGYGSYNSGYHDMFLNQQDGTNHVWGATPQGASFHATDSDNADIIIGAYSHYHSTDLFGASIGFVSTSEANGLMLNARSSTGNITFSAGGFSQTGNYYARLFATGNFTLGNISANPGDPGVLFKAIGDANITGNETLGGTLTLPAITANAFITSNSTGKLQGLGVGGGNGFAIPYYSASAPAALASSNNTLLGWNGTGALTNFSGFVPARTVVATQFDSTSITLGNVTSLTATLAAGGTYIFHAYLNVTANVTGGQKYAIGGTATATSILYEILTTNNSTNALVISSKQTSLGGSASQAAATDDYTEIHGTIVVNAGGTLTVQFAQNTATGTSSVLAGSSFIVERAN